MELNNSPVGISREEYGDLHSAHTIEIYKLYVDLADRVSSRRQSANSFFLAINTALVALAGYVGVVGGADNAEGLVLLSLSGMAVSFMWFRIIRSYRDLNAAKFKVIHDIESALPLRPFDAEWQLVGEGKDPKSYLPFTSIEMKIPWVFLTIHALVFLSVLPWGLLTCGY